MKEEMMHIVKKDKRKLFFLAAIAVFAVFLLILGSEMTSSPQDADEDATVVLNDINDEEMKLEKLLGSMAGVGKVDVIISYDGEPSEQYAYNEDYTEVIQEDGTREIRKKKEMVLVDGNGAPVVTSREHPRIVGVLISAEGALNATVRKNMVDAVASYLDIGKNRIEVMAMEVQ